MSEEQKSESKRATDTFAGMLRAFGQALEEVFDDPQLKQSAREFADSAVDSARTLAGRFGDDDVKAKFREVGRAAEEFGRSVEAYFEEGKAERRE